MKLVNYMKKGELSHREYINANNDESVLHRCSYYGGFTKAIKLMEKKLNIDLRGKLDPTRKKR